MERLSIPNTVVDPAGDGAICFMASRKLSEDELKSYLRAYLRNGNDWPGHGRVATVDILVDHSALFFHDPLNPT